jgi:hypothetical protein
MRLAGFLFLAVGLSVLGLLFWRETGQWGFAIVAALGTLSWGVPWVAETLRRKRTDR